MKKIIIVCLTLLTTLPAFAVCSYTLKCANANRTIEFQHDGIEGSSPYEDISTLKVNGKSMKLLGSKFDEANNTNKAGDFVWSEINSIPASSIYTLTPTAGNGQASVTIIENRGSRSKVTKKSDGVSVESFNFKGTLVLQSASGCEASIAIPEKKVAVSCSNSISCD